MQYWVPSRPCKPCVLAPATRRDIKNRWECAPLGAGLQPPGTDCALRRHLASAKRALHLLFSRRPPAQLGAISRLVSHASEFAAVHSHRYWSFEPRCFSCLPENLHGFRTESQDGSAVAVCTGVRAGAPEYKVIIVQRPFCACCQPGRRIAVQSVQAREPLCSVRRGTYTCVDTRVYIY